MKVYPTFAVVPTYAPVVELLGKSNANMAMIVHGGQLVRLHKAIPAGGTLQTTGTLKAIYDMKKFAQIIIETNTTLGDAPLFDTTWSILVRGSGGFEGKRPPEAPPEPTVPKDRPADWTFRRGDEPRAGAALPHRRRRQPAPRRPRVRDGSWLPAGADPPRSRDVRVRRARGDQASGRRRRDQDPRLQRPVPQAGVAGRHAHHPGVEPREGKVAFNTIVKGRPEIVLGGAWAEIG